MVRDSGKRLLSCAAASGALALLACDPESTTQAGPVSTVPETVVPLSDAEQLRFQRGFGEFLEVDTAIEGLGPLFNGSACAQCHSLGGIGGGGIMRVARAVCVEPDGTHKAPAGGTLIHLFSTMPEVATAQAPTDCEVQVVQRRSTALFGAGLIEAIPDDVLIELARQQDEGIAGRVALVREPGEETERVGRFGWKAQHATLRAFAGDAYLNELGVTNELFPEENASSVGAELIAAMDPAPDPEARVGAIDALADFMRFLAPARASREPSGTFDEIGCADCHVRSLPVDGWGDTVEEARAYSDFLLHDVGTGDGVAQGAALESEFRTAPLWGLRFVPNFLHDGRANSVRAAILGHGGQAEAARQQFLELDSESQGALVRELQSL